VIAQLEHEREVCEQEAKLASLLDDDVSVREDLEKRAASLARRLHHQRTVGAALWEMTSGMKAELDDAIDSRAAAHGDDDDMVEIMRGGSRKQYAAAFERLLENKPRRDDPSPVADLKLLERHLAKGAIKVDAIVDTPNHGPCEPLICAAGACRLDVVRLLIRFGADVHLTGGPHDNTALVTGSQCAESDITRALLEAGAHPDERSTKAGGGSTALIFAASKGVTETVAVLLDAGADVHLRDQMGLTAREWATRNRQRQTAKLIEKHESTVPAPEPERWAAKDALRHASMQGDAKRVRELLEAGNTDVNAADHEGHTALHWAAESGHAEVARLLLTIGKADVNRKASDERLGTTALHIAASEVRSEVVSTLLDNGADVDTLTDGNHLSPLMLAIMQSKDINNRGHKLADVEKVVELLLDAGADAWFLTSGYKGKTALGYAQMCGARCAGIRRLIDARANEKSEL